MRASEGLDDEGLCLDSLLWPLSREKAREKIGTANVTRYVYYSLVCLAKVPLASLIKREVDCRRRLAVAH